MRISIKDKQYKNLFCSKCRRWILSVGKETNGIVYPYCDKCKENIEIKLQGEQGNKVN